MSKSILGTDFMQMTGNHIMGANLKQDVNPEDLKRANEIIQKEQMLYADNIMQSDKDCKSFHDKCLVPTANRVIVLPYDKNPYRIPVHQMNSGLIIGDFGTAETYKSQETGENEAAQRGIWCCKVIAVGRECKSVISGEDVYINFTLAAPLPFGGKGYYSISENNVICSVRPNE